MTVVQWALRIATALAGATIVALALRSAIDTLVLPRGGNTRTALALTTSTRKVLVALASSRPARRERALAMVAPVSLLLMPIAWLVQIWIGYALLFHASGVTGTWEPFRLAGSSILTLGFATGDTPVQDVLSFSAATLGLGVMTLLIAYLPTMYTAFSERETQVSLLAVRAGTPPTARRFMLRYAAVGMGSAPDDADLAELLFVWEEWFAQLRETHTTLASLPLFRSSNPAQSWVTAAGAVLDTASILHSTVVAAPRTAAALCIRSGFLALRDIAAVYGLPFDDDPAPDDQISVRRDEFDDFYDDMAAAGIDLREREQAWIDFAGWRVNYDMPLLELAAMIEAPAAEWTSDRPPLNGHTRMGRPTRPR